MLTEQCTSSLSHHSEEPALVAGAAQSAEPRTNLRLEIADSLSWVECVSLAFFLVPARVFALRGEIFGEFEGHAREAVALAQIARDVLLLGKHDRLPHQGHLVRKIVLRDCVQVLKLSRNVTRSQQARRKTTIASFALDLYTRQLSQALPSLCTLCDKRNAPANVFARAWIWQ